MFLKANVFVSVVLAIVVFEPVVEANLWFQFLEQFHVSTTCVFGLDHILTLMPPKYSKDAKTMRQRTFKNFSCQRSGRQNMYSCLRGQTDVEAKEDCFRQMREYLQQCPDAGKAGGQQQQQQQQQQGRRRRDLEHVRQFYRQFPLFSQ